MRAVCPTVRARMILETVDSELHGVNTNGITSRRRENDVSGSVPRNEFRGKSVRRGHNVNITAESINAARYQISESEYLLHKIIEASVGQR